MLLQRNWPDPRVRVANMIRTTQVWDNDGVRRLRRFCVDHGIGERELVAIGRRVQREKGGGR